MKLRYLMTAIAILCWVGVMPGYSQDNPAASQIDAISDEGAVVLSDVTFPIAADARFFAEDERTPISFSIFQEGDWVEFSVNSNGEIDEMWLSSE